ncbi:TonB-dependent receptor family protein [Thioalkalivibrio sulfidiphilus]|uniref:TonB-dependent receptor family protein n=1 Tax=Thioalkalivibrio sulfidiphilus TaxID=1033854 RepID=UPI001E39249B|nr:TonB-dependent receptor [Thioalkalivibrio sulfidiphilus]
MFPRPYQSTLLCAALSLPLTLAAETQRLEPLTVTAPRLERPWLDTPAALSVLEREDLEQARQGLQLDESLVRIPGVTAQNRYNFAQDLRVSMRGFGARSAFGIRGVKLLVDGIPETTTDGQSQVDAIDLTALERIEVIRGPSSVLHGNATGGVLDITTRSGPPETFLQPRLEAGSDGYRRIGAQAGGQAEALAWHVSGWDFAMDGYRDHSVAEKRLLHSRLDWDLAAGHRLTALATFLDAPRTDDPGALTATEVAMDRRMANPNALRFDAGQSVTQERLGLVYRGDLSEGEQMQARVFHTWRNFDNRLPFGPAIGARDGMVSYDRVFYGAGVQYTRENHLGSLPGRMTLGLDLERQQDDRRRFQNLQGVRGDLTFEQRETAEAAGVFVQQEVDLTERLQTTLGLRRDRVRFAVDDQFLNDGDDSGSRTFQETSQYVGLSYAWHPQHRIYGAFGTAFETPTFTEYANPAGGGFNPAIKPQQARNLELGFKGFAGALQYDLAVFRVDVRDELVPYELEGDGRTYYENAGRTRRQGLEAGLSWFASPQWTFTGAWTYSDFTFREFEVNDVDLAGRELPAIPRQQLFLEAAWRPGRDYYILDMLALDRQYADNANTERVSGTAIFNARAGWVFRQDGWDVETFVAVNNLFDQGYFANIRPNAAFGRYYEPAPGRNFFVGLHVTRR